MSDKAPGLLLALLVNVGELERDPIVGEIIDSAIEVHRVLGPGMLESAYAHCLSYDMSYLRLTRARRALLLNFNGLTLKAGLRSFIRKGVDTPEEKS